MTWTLAETFDDPQGRWNEYAPWDASIYSEPDKAFLTTQRHVDLRNFRVFTETVPVPQNPDLDTVEQTVLEGYEQTRLEVKPGATVVTEDWILSGTGSNSDMTVGKLGDKNGWSGLRFTTDGNDLAIFLNSSLPGDPVDLSAMEYLSMVFPDHHTFDGFLSYVQLTSDPDGVFGNGHDSTQVTFDLNESVMPHLLFTLGDFDNAGFSNAAVTGVRIYLSESAPLAGLNVTLMAIRGLMSTWEESWLDFDTRLGAVCIPVTLDGAPYIGTVAEEFEFVRGDGSQNDPIPIDGAYNMYFYPGGEVGRTSIDPLVNRLSLLLREIKDIPDNTGSYIQVSLLWNDSGTNMEVYRVDVAAGVKTFTTLHTISVGGPLDDATHYLWNVQIKGTQINAKIYDTTIQKELISTVWFNLDLITDEDLTYRTGRVGFVAALIDRDAYLDAISVAPTGYASLLTRVYNSRSVVDGAQLAATYADDVNLFSSVTGLDLLVDQTKTLAGAGSYRTAKGITTNQFIVDDWTQTYLKLAIWVPNSVSLTNQPNILLNTTSGQLTLSVPKLQPAQWNSLEFDLGLFRDLLTGVAYSFTISGALEPDKPLGNFWVDNSIVVGRRRIAWSVRATDGGPFRYFRSLVNNPTGGVHFLPAERGTKLQLRAEALTPDAWVSSFKLFPRYAELGLPVYDQGFETR